MYDIERFQELLISENSRTVCIIANFSLQKEGGRKLQIYLYLFVYVTSNSKRYTITVEEGQCSLDE